MTTTNQANRCAVLIITSSKLEYDSVRDKLDVNNAFAKLYAVKCERGVIKEEYGVPRDVIILQTSSDKTLNVSSNKAPEKTSDDALVPPALGIERAIYFFRPEIVIFVGIAAKVNKKPVKSGDVVAATKIYAFTPTQEEADFAARPQILSCSYRLQQHAWITARKQSQGDDKPTSRVHLAPIATGPKAIAEEDSQVYQFLQSPYSDALAIDTDGVGFLETIQMNRNVNAIIIRGIATDLKSRRNSPAQKLAADHACKFAFNLLDQLKPGEKRKPLQNTLVPSMPSFAALSTIPLIEVLFAYAEEDERLVHPFQMQLIAFKQRQLISDWYGVSSAAVRDFPQPDEKLPRKKLSELDKELPEHIQQHLDKARIIVLFVSPDFLCVKQLNKIAADAMERQQGSGVTVLPVLLCPTEGWKDTVFGVLQAIPRNKPVNQFVHLWDAMAKVIIEVRAVIEQLRISG